MDAVVFGVHPVGHPLSDVAGHVEYAGCACAGRSLPDLPRAASATLKVRARTGRLVLSPRERACVAATCRALPLGLGRQTLESPDAVGTRLVPVHARYRVIALRLAAAAGDDATASIDARPIRIFRHLGAIDIERREGYVVHRRDAFDHIATTVAARAAHQECSRLDVHHLRRARNMAAGDERNAEDKLVHVYPADHFGFLVGDAGCFAGDVVDPAADAPGIGPQMFVGHQTVEAPNFVP